MRILELSEITGVPRNQIRNRLAAQGIEPASREVTVAAGGRPNWHVYHSEQALRALYGGEALDPQMERAMLDRARRQTVELQLEQRRGTVLPAEETRSEILSAVTVARNQLLALPSRVAPEVMALDSLRDIELLLKDAIVDALTALQSELAQRVAVIAGADGEDQEDA